MLYSGVALGVHVSDVACKIWILKLLPLGLCDLSFERGACYKRRSDSGSGVCGYEIQK